MSQDSAERTSEFHVENGVDERIEEAVDVAEPDEEREEQRVEMTRRTQLEQVVANADGVDDVNREERNPAKHENSCQHYRRHLASDTESR